jgi:Ca-activated chloride channel family protein
MGEFEFGMPERLWWLLVVPLILLIYWALLRMRRRKLRRLGNETTLKELMPDYSAARGWVKVSLYVGAIALLILAAAHPRTGSKLHNETREGREVVLVVDVSNSMLAEDIKPSRMERTCYAITQLIESMTEDGIGVVAFADEPMVLLPVTSEYRTAKAKVKHLNPGLIPNQGTNLAQAIEAAALSFSSNTENKHSRVMIIISDGEDHDNEAIAAAQRAATDGAIICCIGIGTPEGTPFKIDGVQVLNEQGKIELTKLNEALLQEIASVGDGIYTRSTNEEFGLDAIIERLDEVERAKLKHLKFEDFEEQYQWFIGAALVLLVLEMMILSRRNPLLRNVHMFDSNMSNR